jgi:hypothetical protein
VRIEFNTLAYHERFPPVAPQKPEKNNSATHNNTHNGNNGDKYLRGP